MFSLVALVVLAVSHSEILSQVAYIITHSCLLYVRQSEHVQMLAEFDTLWFHNSLENFGYHIARVNPNTYCITFFLLTFITEYI